MVAFNYGGENGQKQDMYKHHEEDIVWTALWEDSEFYFAPGCTSRTVNDSYEYVICEI